MTRIVLATCAAFPDLYDDDRALIPALAARGLAADVRVWNDPRVAWGGYALVVVRSPWDYHHHAADFAAWIDRVSAAAPIVNPPALLRWNLHKGYLRDLEARGVRTVPTAWIARGEGTDLAALLEARGWTDAVVKPALSAGAENTLRVGSHDRARMEQGSALLASIVAGGDAMVQPYLPSVEEYGERSLLHFDGVLSHAIRKHPLLAPGAIDRLQQGEGVPRVDVSDAERRFASRVLEATRDATGHVPAYARVDVAVDRDGAPLLMELEALEPCLFLRAGSAHERFADVLAARIGA